MTYSVLGLGCAAVDIVLNCNILPKEDGFSLINGEDNLCGGCCTNTLYTIKNLGIDSSYIGKLGDDSFGSIIIKDLNDNLINTKFTVIKQDGITLHTYITVDKSGNKCIFSNVGDTLLDLSEDDVPLNTLDNIDLFFTDMFPSKPSIKIAKMCKEKGVKVIFNLQCNVDFMNSCGVTLSEIEEIISLSDYFITNKPNFLNLIERKWNSNSISKYINYYSRDKNLIITNGKEEVTWANNKVFTSKTFNINSIDSTGAGDAFLAGIIYSHAFKGNDIESSLVFSNACATIKCLKNGPRANFCVNDVLDFINNNIHRRNT